MDISELEKATIDRSNVVMPGLLNNMALSYFTTALAEETGEVCGAVKKILRSYEPGGIKPEKIKALMDEFPDMAHSNIMELYRGRLVENLEGEIGDVVSYLIYICHKSGLNFEHVLIEGFVKSSEKWNYPIMFDVLNEKFCKPE